MPARRRAVAAVESTAAPVPDTAAVTIAGGAATEPYADGRCRSANALCAGPAGRAIIPTGERPTTSIPDRAAIGIALWIATGQRDTGVRTSRAIPATGDIRSQRRILGCPVLARIGDRGVRSLGRAVAARGCIVCNRAAHLPSVAGASPQRNSPAASRKNGSCPEDHRNRNVPLATAHDPAIVHRQERTGARKVN